MHSICISVALFCFCLLFGTDCLLIFSCDITVPTVYIYTYVWVHMGPCAHMGPCGRTDGWTEWTEREADGRAGGEGELEARR